MNIETGMRWAEGAFGIVFEASLLASVLMILVAAIQCAIGKRLSPSWRFALWTIVLVRLLMPIAPESRFSLFNASHWFEQEKAVTSAPVPPLAPIVEANGAELLDAMQRGPIQLEELQPVAEAAEPLNWRAICSVIWLIGVGLLLARLVVGNLWVLSRLRKSAKVCANQEATETLLAAATELQTIWRPILVETKLVNSPAVFGLFRPRLLIPPGFCDSRSTRELRHVFLHELAHLKRGDLFTNALIVLAQAVHWMNPLAWLAMRQMRIERELACDEMALRALGGATEPRAYGETILRLLEGVPPRRALPALVGIAEEKHSARKRLAQIAAFDSRRKRWGVLSLLIVIPLALGGLTNARTNSAESFDVVGEMEQTGGLHTQVERLIQQAKQMMAAGDFNDAEMKLKEARRLAPNHRVIEYYATLLEERRYSQVNRPPVQFAREPWEAPQKAFAQADNPYAPRNRVNSGKGRQAVVKKLQELRINYYDVPKSVKLSEIIKDLHATARKLDPEKTGVNFIFSSQINDPGSNRAALPPDLLPEVPPLKIGDYVVTLSPALRDVTLIGLLDAIVEVAVPPKGYESAPRLRYSIEEYGVVFGQRVNEREQLYTRTFKIDPNTFLQGLDLQFNQQMLEGADEPGRLSRVQQAARQFFVAAGLEFPTNQNVNAAGAAVQPQKAMFYNDRTGILMVRAPLGDLQIVEQALQALEAKNPKQLVFSVEFVEVKTFGEFVDLLGPITDGGEFKRNAITDPEFRELKQAAQKRFTFEQMPRVTTLVGRPARVGIEGRGSIHLNALYQDADKTFELNAAWFAEDGKQRVKTGVIYDGQTFVLLPEESERSVQQELRRKLGLRLEDIALTDGRVAFITARLIDPAGNIVNNDNEFIEKTSSEVPPKRR